MGGERKPPWLVALGGDDLTVGALSGATAVAFGPVAGIANFIHQLGQPMGGPVASRLSM